MNFLSRFIRHQVMDNPDQPPEGVTDVPPSPSNALTMKNLPHQDFSARSGHHHVLSTCAVHVLASPACHVRPGNAGRVLLVVYIILLTQLPTASCMGCCDTDLCVLPASISLLFTASGAGFLHTSLELCLYHCCSAISTFLAIRVCGVLYMTVVMRPPRRALHFSMRALTRYRALLPC
eukprot:scpid103245/ scgid19337/ 